MDHANELHVLKRRTVRTALAAAYYDGIARYLASRPYGLAYDVTSATASAPAGGTADVRVRLTNRGKRASTGWTLEARMVPRVPVYDGSPKRGTLLAQTRLPDGLAPGASIDASLLGIPMPSRAGDWLLKLDVRLPSGSLGDHGVVGPQLPITTTSVSATPDPTAPPPPDPTTLRPRPTRPLRLRPTRPASLRPLPTRPPRPTRPPCPRRWAARSRPMTRGSDRPGRLSRLPCSCAGAPGVSACRTTRSRASSARAAPGTGASERRGGAAPCEPSTSDPIRPWAWPARSATSTDRPEGSPGRYCRDPSRGPRWDSWTLESTRPHASMAIRVPASGRACTAADPSPSTIAIR